MGFNWAFKGLNKTEVQKISICHKLLDTGSLFWLTTIVSQLSLLLSCACVLSELS